MHAARLTAITLVLFASSGIVLAQSPATGRKILVVHNGDSHSYPRELVDRGLITTVRASKADVDVYFEYLDLFRFSSPSDASMLASQLRQKYEGRDLRAVVAVTDSALAFLRTQRLFQDVPTVAYTEGRPPSDAASAEPNVVRVWSGSTAVDTIELALRLHPSTRELVVLSGKPNNDGEYEKEVRAQLAAFSGRLKVTALTDLEPDKTLAAVRSLPPDALVLFLRLIETPQANRDLRSVGAVLSNVSPVPFYALKDTRVGEGAVGGYVGDTISAGSQVAAIAMRLAQGTHPRDIPAEQVRVVPMFDWRQLQRWGISESQLPAGSTILFKQPTAWEQYKPQIIAGTLVLMLQTTLIASLLVQRTRRRRLEQNLRESQSRYALATAAGAVGVWDRNLATDDLYVDPKLKAILGFEDAQIPNRVGDWKARVHPGDAEAMTHEPAPIAGDTDAYEIEHRMLHKDGSLRWFLSNGSVMRRADGTPYRMVGTSVDITERKRAADQFRLALEAATTGMLMVTPTGTIVLVNAHVERLFGYRREELINGQLEMLLPDRSLALLPEGSDHLASDTQRVPIRPPRELNGLRKDGAGIPVEIGFSPIQTSEGAFVLCSIADITERKQAEREREDLMRHLQDLAGRLIAAQEVERARIARDLHDDVSQQLAGLSIALSGLKRRAQGTDLQSDVSSLQQRTGRLAESVRDLSHDLHPDVIRHNGLAASLSVYCNELSLSKTLTVTCNAQGDFESMDPEAALCLYRITQEALHNVVKHSQGRHAEVRLIRTGDGAELTIVDDGNGFDVQTRKSSKGLGLVSITERARLAGGTVSIVTALNKGTQVRVQVPISPRGTTAGNPSERFASSV